MTPRPSHVVLNYLGTEDDRGGIVSVVRTLAAERQFDCVLGVNPGFVQHREPHLATLVLPRIAGDRIGPVNALRARVVARAAQDWLHEDARRIFHARSRSGLLVALWLHAMGERRVVASVHWFGRQRWFYRWAARVFGGRLIWLGPAMRRHYGLAGTAWENCIPDCVSVRTVLLGNEKPWRGAPVCLGCAGGLVPVKQWELVLRALATLPIGLPVRVVHAGNEDGSAASAVYARKLRELAAQHGVSDRIEWRGTLPSLNSFFREIDCLVVASRWEASSVAALEALAAGVPVIAADAAGTRDLIEACDGGWLFRSDDVGDLARVMTTLAGATALARARIGADRLRPFTAPVVAAQWCDAYSQLSARK